MVLCSTKQRFVVENIIYRIVSEKSSVYCEILICSETDAVPEPVITGAGVCCHKLSFVVCWHMAHSVTF